MSKIFLIFFKELGVYNLVRNKNSEIRRRLVERIGINVTIVYESSLKNIPHELTDSEKRGRSYDIESNDFLIEVKGIASTEKNLTISANEIQTLIKNQDI